MKAPTFTPEVEGAMLSLLYVFQSPNMCEHLVGSVRMAEAAQRLAAKRSDDLLDFNSGIKSEDPIADIIEAAANWGASTMIGFMAMRALTDTLQGTKATGNG